MIMAGLPGTGKSTVAAAIAKRLDGIVLSKDILRAALFPPVLIDYSSQQDEFCFHVMLETSEYLFRKNPECVVVLDGRTFSREVDRKNAVELAERIPTPWRIVECVCSEATAIARIERDLADGSHPAKNRTAALYHRVKAGFESIGEPKTVVDTESSTDFLQSIGAASS